MLNLSAYYLGPVVKLCLFLLSSIKPLLANPIWQTINWQLHFGKPLTGKSIWANPWLTNPFWQTIEWQIHFGKSLTGKPILTNTWLANPFWQTLDWQIHFDKHFTGKSILANHWLANPFWQTHSNNFWLAAYLNQRSFTKIDKYFSL